VTAGALAPAAEPAWTTALGRRVSVGIRASPGVHSRLPAWWGRVHWCEVTAQLALQLRTHVCKEEHVLPATALRYARAIAPYADGRTGRHCRPTNERLMRDLGMSRTHLKRCRRVLERLGVLVVTVQGRSVMTLRERLRAWRNGSSHRQLAAEYALIVPRRPHPPADPVEHGPPPREAWVPRSPHLICGSSVRNRPKEERASARTHRRRARSGPTLAQIRTSRLAAGLQRRLGWLRATSPRRLTSLHRFAQQGWTPLDVHDALDGVLRARAWSVPDEVRQPAAYLATLLRGVDEHDRPGALREQLLEAELERRRHQYAIDFGQLAECEHAQPGGAELVNGRARCPLCRRA
jgi:hypothetical protein